MSTALDFAAPANIRILLVEDESIIARDIKDCLENLGYMVVAIAASGAEAILRAEELRPHLVLMDIRLRGELDGIQTAEQIWNRLQIPIVYSTGFSDKSTLERAKLTRPFGYILKPVEERELYVAVETALQQYQANQSLQYREQWLNTILRDIGDGVIVVDTEGQIRLMNLVAQALTGWTQDEAAGRALTEVFRLVYERTGEAVDSPVTQTLRHGALTYLPDRILLIAKDGTSIPISDAIAPIRNQQEAVVGAVISFRDVTQRRVAEERDLALRRAEQLELQMTELQRLNQLKDDFLNTVSHELRTPLANMKMAIQMLEITLDQKTASNAESVENINSRTTRYLEILREQCNRELSLVNDLLDLQRLNAETYAITLTTVQLQEWIPHAIESFQERIQYNQLTLQMNIPANLPAIRSDTSSLIRIVVELLNNACKYTPLNGTIAISVDLENKEMALPETIAADVEEQLLDTVTLVLKICNSGIEIAAEELPKIFDQFYRIPHSDLRNEGGTGLGLALVKKLVLYLGGTIQAESSAGQTCFTIELPTVCA